MTGQKSRETLLREGYAVLQRLICGEAVFYFQEPALHGAAQLDPGILDIVICMASKVSGDAWLGVVGETVSPYALTAQGWQRRTLFNLLHAWAQSGCLNAVHFARLPDYLAIRLRLDVEQARRRGELPQVSAERGFKAYSHWLHEQD